MDQPGIKVIRHALRQASGGHPNIAFAGICGGFFHQGLNGLLWDVWAGLVQPDVPLPALFARQCVGARFFVDPIKIGLNPQVIQPAFQHPAGTPAHPCQRGTLITDDPQRSRNVEPFAAPFQAGLGSSQHFIET